MFHEANSSIEYFNDNDETVLQGETQYKHAVRSYEIEKEDFSV